MNELQAIQDAVNSILLEMENQNYSSGAIKTHSSIYNTILKYMATNAITSISETVCLDFLHFHTGYKMPGFYGKGNRKINQTLKPLQVLLDYINTGTVIYKMRSKVHSYICPSQFEEEYIAFQDIFEERRYAKSTIICINQLLQKFLLFLDQSSIHSSKEICIQPITKFISNYKDCKPKYISTIISTLRNYLSFLYTEGFIINDVSKSLPNVRIMRNTFIPYSWKTEDVKKLLQAVDRGDPKRQTRLCNTTSCC